MIIWIVLVVVFLVVFAGIIGFVYFRRFQNYKEQAKTQVYEGLSNLGQPNYEFVNPEIESQLHKAVFKEVFSIKNNFGLARNNHDWEAKRIEKNCFNIVKDFYEQDSGVKINDKPFRKQPNPSRSQILNDETISLEERNRLIKELEHEIRRQQD